MPATTAPDPERLALAREVIAIGFPEAEREALFFDAVDAMVKQTRKVMLAQMQNDVGATAISDRKIEGFVQKSKTVLRSHIPALMDGMAQGYAREFSSEDLIQIRAFATTSSGQHFFLRSSAIIGDPGFAAANESYLRDLQPMIGQMRDELTAELTAYFAKHPPKSTTKS
ncbi:MAG: hypothetical protein ACKVOL_13270 [Novosphingobium sp.]